LKKSPSADIIKIAKNQFSKVVNDQKPRDTKDKTPVKSFDDIIKPDAEPLLEEQIFDAINFINRFRINVKGKGVMFVNGKYFDLDDVSNIY
jgi:hypothetical protein